MGCRVLQFKCGPVYLDNVIILLQLHQKLPWILRAHILEMIVIIYPNPPIASVGIWNPGWSQYIDIETNVPWWYHKSDLGEFYYKENEGKVRLYDVD